LTESELDELVTFSSSSSSPTTTTTTTGYYSPSRSTSSDEKETAVSTSKAEAAATTSLIDSSAEQSPAKKRKVLSKSSSNITTTTTAKTITATNNKKQKTSASPSNNNNNDNAWGFLDGTFASSKKAAVTKPKERAPKKSKAASTKKQNSAQANDDTEVEHKRNNAASYIKVPYSAGDDLPIITEPQAMFDDMIAQRFGLDDRQQRQPLLSLLKKLQDRPLKVATMCSGTESPILALDMLQKAISKLLQESPGGGGGGDSFTSILPMEHVFSCEIEPFKQAYIERNFAPPLLFRDIRELGQEEAFTAYGALARVPNKPGEVDLLIAGTSCVDYSNLNNRKVCLNFRKKCVCLWLNNLKLLILFVSFSIP
jgi:hypothetical protein